MHRTAAALAACRHPLVAQIHGICVGGGLEIAALCDLRICGASSRFGAPIKNLGLVMAYPEMAPLVRLAGPAVALEILLEGRVFDAAGSAREGPRHARRRRTTRWRTKARATAERIAEGAPLVARWHKKFARRLADPRPITADRARRGFDCFDTEDFREGYAAFLAKRKPSGVRSGARRLSDEQAHGHPGPLAGHARSRARADHGGAHVRRHARGPGRRRRSRSRSYRAATTRAATASRASTASRRRSSCSTATSAASRSTSSRRAAATCSCASCATPTSLIENYRRDTMDKLGPRLRSARRRRIRRSSIARSPDSAATGRSRTAAASTWSRRDSPASWRSPASLGARR